MANHKFYTLTSASTSSDQLLFTRIGANDPEFNLRRDAAFMIRRQDAKDTVFASIVEPHGSYSPVSELAVDANSRVRALEVIYDDANYTAVSIEYLAGDKRVFLQSNTDVCVSGQHQLEIGEKRYEWTGPYHYF